MCKNQRLVKFELPVLANNLAKYLKTNGLRSHDEATGITTGAIFAKYVLEIEEQIGKSIRLQPRYKQGT